MATLSSKEKELLKRQLKTAKKWRYFFDRLCLIGRVAFKIGYIILFVISFIYALSDHNVPKDIAIALNKIRPIMER